MAKKAIATQDNHGVPSVPDYLKEHAGQGIEDVDKSVIIVPRIKLLQALSPEVAEGDEKSGDFFHTVAEESLGDKIFMVPIYISTSYIMWRPRKDGGGILARALDGVHWDCPDTEFEVKLDSGAHVTWHTGKTVQQSGLMNFGTSDPDDRNSAPAATMMINIITVFPDHLDLSPSLVSLSKSSEKVGKQFCSKIAIANAPSWGRKFEMYSFLDQNKNGDKFYNFKFRAAGFVEEKESVSYKETYEHFRSQRFKASDEESMDVDEVSSGAGDGEY